MAKKRWAEFCGEITRNIDTGGFGLSSEQKKQLSASVINRIEPFLNKGELPIRAVIDMMLEPETALSRGDKENLAILIRGAILAYLSKQGKRSTDPK